MKKVQFIVIVLGVSVLLMGCGDYEDYEGKINGEPVYCLKTIPEYKRHKYECYPDMGD